MAQESEEKVVKKNFVVFSGNILLPGVVGCAIAMAPLGTMFFPLLFLGGVIFVFLMW